MTREYLMRLIAVIATTALVLLAAQPVRNLINRNLSSVALARYANANKCSPLSLLRCPTVRPDAATGAEVDLAAANNSSDSSVVRNRGLYLILRGSYQPADAALRLAAAQSPADDRAAFALSTVDLREGRSDEAVAIWRRLRATPLVANYADLAMQGHDYAGARSLYQLAVEVNPADPILKTHLAAADHALAALPAPPATTKSATP